MLGSCAAITPAKQSPASRTRQSLRLAPDRYENLVNSLLSSQRFDEARQIIHESQVQKRDNPILHNALYALAFLGADAAAMAEQQQWFAGNPAYENQGLALASDTAAYGGHVGNARELAKRAVDSAVRADNKEGWGDLFGECCSARSGLRLSYRSPAGSGRSFEACARESGRRGRIRACLGHVGRHGTNRFLGPRVGETLLDTQMRSLWLPAIQAQLALDKKNPASALTALQAASPIELGQIAFVANISCLYHVYVRGEAYLAAEQGSAAAEFQRILDHSGIVWNCWTGALAHLGVARANALQAKTSQGADADAARVRARTAYKDFLTLWKDADPDIPILKEAKAENAKLQ